MSDGRTFKRALVLVNPEAGGANRGRFETAFESEAGGIEHRIRRLEAGEDAEEVTRRELGGKWDVVLAAGGDGTVSGVARAARLTDTPVAIAPLGTGNILADQLGIPSDINQAIRLLKGDWAVRRIDAMEIGGRLYLLNAGVGLSASTVRDVKGDDKRRFGLTAYLWTGLARSFTFRPVRCTVTVDGRSRRLRVLDVSIINAGFRIDRPMPGMPEVKPDDGMLDVLIVWAPRPLEYLRHLERGLFHMRGINANIQWKTAEKEIRIACADRIPVQADGDLIAETPITVRVVPDAVGIVVPAARVCAERT
ncbi:MAG: diacylglycerol kinase family lipid kinase [Candidatus Eisenbacteria bacterium]|nr:diacylglycerol kinase family lipid kinase [Candidatus Eisenbacteria bacterium]